MAASSPVDGEGHAPVPEAAPRRCSKARYPTEHSARVALVGVLISHNSGRKKRKECRVYHCGKCHCWHLTSWH
jgi:hypothetical protein